MIEDGVGIGEKMISKEIIDEAFKFYNIGSSYIEECYRCAEEINQNEYYKKNFKNVYETLYCSDFSRIKSLWEIKDINELFGNNVNPFVTNLMIILGYEFHKNNMNRYKLNISQMLIHKCRVKECFENDLIYRKYNGVRISQMLWAVYFVRIRIIEIGRLQYEYEDTENNISMVKIHIPKGRKLNLEEVKCSIKDSKDRLKQIFKLDKIKYFCNSWLLSNQVYNIIDRNSNISLFHNLFDVEDGRECTDDIMNFVYGINKCSDYRKLSEETILQKKIKEQLLNGEKFYLGLGVLKQDI